MPKNCLLFALMLVLAACRQGTYQKMESSRTGITFNNRITENDSINILDMEYVYNGGGVAISDFNNDGLQDVFFTGNQAGNRLYLNKGDWAFGDITGAARVGAADRWNTGVAAVDINNDGWMDLYVCASMKKDPALRANMLFINKGVNGEGVPVFADESRAYGIADTGHSTTAAFFDYDNDGDLDLYVLTNKMAGEGFYANQYRKKITDGSSPTTDRLYRNDWDPVRKHPVYTDVSAEAGILIEGYGLGLNICDINRDGWKDIYVTNDFLTNDLLWINNRNGTFTNRAAEAFKHTSYSAMGNDVADINNDGLADVIAVDMLPATNRRKKMMTPANAYQTYMNNDAYGYEYQYGRNTLQLNQGLNPSAGDSVSLPVFADIAFYAGVAETDWSWTPLVSDFDNDGYRDLIITNGFPKDITDRDFMTYRANARNVASKEEILEQIPAVKLRNFVFRNNGDLSFSEVSEKWGIEEEGFSSGGAYGDLDNDGDLDLVINNINDEAFVYRNTASKRDGARYLQVKFEGTASNLGGLGARAEIYYEGGKQQVYEHAPYRGYLSTVQPLAHFGVGKAPTIDSLVIRWPNGTMQVLRDVATNRVITVRAQEAKLPYSFAPPAGAETALFSEITDSLGIDYRHKEIDFPDFNIQKLLPHKLSEFGPAMAVGDIDRNGLDDLVCGGSFAHSATLFLQQPNGKFISRELVAGAGPQTKPSEDMGLLLFDAEGDGDLDLYIASGSYESEPRGKAYEDLLYINDGRGNLHAEEGALPPNFISKSCVRASDYDRDGDLDLFVAGRVEPWNYPKPVSSFIYRNDSRNGTLRFTDVTGAVAGDLKDIGMICDAVWTDFNNDGWQDLVLAGEWMPVTLFKNDRGSFRNITATTGISNRKGWWTSIAPADVDNDGDTDYLLGNVGQNTFYKADDRHPARIYAKDFDGNGSYDAVPSLFLADEKGVRKEYPAQTRDDLIKQMISMRARFHTYRSFADATLDKVFTPEELKDAVILEANSPRSSLLSNKGDGRFELVALPVEAQLTLVNGMVVDDFDGDGNADVVMNTNDFGTEVSIGRYDAGNGLFLKGDGRGGFKAAPIDFSGIFIPGNGKALVRLMGAGGSYLLAASQNRGALKVYTPRNVEKLVAVRPDDASALIRYRNGGVQKQEFTYGSSFLSQSGRFLCLPETVLSVEVTDFRGQKRSLALTNTAGK